MTLPNPEHLVDQAAELATPPPVGAPRQANLRRAVSTVYYALFHAILTDVADQLVGKGQRDTPQYALVYRSVQHRQLTGLCGNIVKEKPPDKQKPYVPQGGFGSDLLTVAKLLIVLQGNRHRADYDPRYRMTSSDASMILQTGRTALGHWRSAPAPRRRLFILLLTFL